MKKLPPELHILQIWTVYLPTFSGAAIHHNHLAPLLKEQGIIVEVLVPGRDGLSEKETINGVQVTRLPSGPFHDQYLQLIWSGVYLCQELWRRRREYDLVHVLSVEEVWSPIFQYIKIFLGKPVVLEYTLMESKEKSPAGKLLEKIAGVFCKGLDSYIAISSPLVQEIKAKGVPASKCSLIYNGVNIEKFVPVQSEERAARRHQFGLEQDDYYLIFVGSITQRKGVDVLIEMMERLRKIREDVHLLLVGPHDFPHFPSNHPVHRFALEIQERICRSDLQHHVRMVNRVTLDEVLRWLQAADVFVFPSRREGLGGVILEAMAVGLPCVCSEMDGIAYDLIEPRVNGIVVKENNADAFTEEVLQLIENPGLRQRLGDAARQTMIERFDERKVALEYKKLFGTLFLEKNR
jgi:glycosyltransferase involved in cell wall biosynthesis